MNAEPLIQICVTRVYRVRPRFGELVPGTGESSWV